MIALDTNILVALFQDEDAADIRALAALMETRPVALPPVVLTEFLSFPSVTPELRKKIGHFARLEIQDGYWERAGRLRAALIAKGLKPKLADTLIAQNCIDHDAPLLTRDRDFNLFASHTALQLAKV